MLKTTKVLIIIAIVLLAVSLGLTVYQYYFQVKSVSSGLDQGNISATPRAELFGKYFTSAALASSELMPSADVVINWKLQPKFAVATKFLVRLVDKQQNIFISETQPLLLKNYSGTKVKAPTKAGGYEAWLYLIETDNTQALAQVFPFSVK